MNWIDMILYMFISFSAIHVLRILVFRGSNLRIFSLFLNLTLLQANLGVVVASVFNGLTRGAIFLISRAYLPHA